MTVNLACENLAVFLYIWHVILLRCPASPFCAAKSYTSFCALRKALT